MRTFSKVLLTVLAFVSILTSVGVYATWQYTISPPSDVSHEIPLTMKEYSWEGTEDLPGEEEGDLGLNHHWLIQNLVSGTDASGTEIGLNNPNSQLNQYIDDRLDGGWGWSRDYFGSMAVTGGSYMQQLFGTEAENLSFLVRVVSDKEYYIYTTSIDLGERGEPNWIGTSNKEKGKPNIPIGEWVYPVFRTKLTRTNANEDWTIVLTERGRAKSDWYDENRSNANVTQIPSFDPATWEVATMGGSTADAIWTFVGDVATANPESKTAPIYYRLKPSSAGTYTVKTYAENAVVRVLNASGTVIANSANGYDADGTKYVYVTFSATANAQYYVQLSGNTSIIFNIS